MADADLAEACAAAMWQRDQASQGLGTTVENVGPGTCHGGFIFALADSAFAFACNSDGAVSVASHCGASVLCPAALGEWPVATAAAERHRAGRSGLHDGRVTAGEDIVAEFRGHSRTAGVRLLEGADAG